MILIIIIINVKVIVLFVLQATLF